MFDFLTQDSFLPSVQEIAVAFRRWGWIGFWVQILFAFIPVLILIFALFFSHNPADGMEKTIYVGEILAFACLLALVFTIYWCFRYVQLSKRLEEPKMRPPKAEVIQCLWIGLIANISGMLCAVLVAMGRVATLLWKMLSLPQGASLISTPGNDQTIIRPRPSGRGLNYKGSVIVPLHMVGIQAMFVRFVSK